MLIDVLDAATTREEGSGLPVALAVPLFLLIGAIAVWYWRKDR